MSDKNIFIPLAVVRKFIEHFGIYRPGRYDVDRDDFIEYMIEYARTGTTDQLEADEAEIRQELDQ